MHLNIALLLCTVLLPRLGFSIEEIRAYHRSGRIEALGGAYVSLADDASSLFLNPAGLANFEKGAFHVAITDVEFSTDVVSTALNGLSGLTSPDVNLVNALMGKNIYGRAQIAPVIAFNNFGLSYFLDAQTALYMWNKALPRITFGYQLTHGAQVGYGFNLLGRRRRGGQYGSLKLGLGAKILFRKGGYRKVPTSTLFRFGEGLDLVNELAGSWGIGYGFDVGLLYSYPIGRHVKFSLGSAFRNIGDVTFTTGDPDSIKGDWGIGTSVKYEGKSWSALLSYEFSDLLLQTDWRKKNHLGVEISLPIVKLYAGLNQTYLTYGVGLDFWIFSLTAMSYGEELGALSYQSGNRRYLVRLDFKLALF